MASTAAADEPTRPGSAAGAQLLHLPGGFEDASTPRAIPQAAQPSRCGRQKRKRTCEFSVAGYSAISPFPAHSSAGMLLS